MSFDYCFLRDATGGESITVLVGREKYSKFMAAHVVPYKGAGEPIEGEGISVDINPSHKMSWTPQGTLEFHKSEHLYPTTQTWLTSMGCESGLTASAQG